MTLEMRTPTCNPLSSCDSCCHTCHLCVRHRMARLTTSRVWTSNQRLGVVIMFTFWIGVVVTVRVRRVMPPCPVGARLTSRVAAAMQCLNLPSSRLLYRATAAAVTVLGARLALNFGLLYYTFFRGNGNTGFPVYRGATDEMIERLERFEWPLLRDGSLPTPDQQKAATRGNRGDGNEAGNTGSDEPDDSDSQARHMCVVRVAFLCLAASTACCACIAVVGRGHTAADTRGCRCAICLAPFELGQPMVGLPCHLSHVFHAECCVPWLRRQRACPLCQRDIDMVPVPAGKRPSALDKVVCDALALKAATGEVAGASDAHAVIGQAPSLQGSAPTIVEETAGASDVD